MQRSFIHDRTDEAHDDFTCLLRSANKFHPMDPLASRIRCLMSILKMSTNRFVCNAEHDIWSNSTLRTHARMEVVCGLQDFTDEMWTFWAGTLVRIFTASYLPGGYVKSCLQRFALSDGVILDWTSGALHDEAATGVHRNEIDVCVALGHIQVKR